MQTSKTEREYGGGRRWWTRERREAGWGGGGGGSGEGLKKLSHRSRVFERARPTPSCSCLPPTACNFLAKALMRGLARDGRSPRTSREREREREGLDSLRSLARSILFSPSPHSLLFSSLFFSLPPSLLSFLSSLTHVSSSLASLLLSLLRRQSPRRWRSRAVCASRYCYRVPEFRSTLRYGTEARQGSI